MRRRRVSVLLALFIGGIGACAPLPRPYTKMPALVFLLGDSAGLPLRAAGRPVQSRVIVNALIRKDEWLRAASSTSDGGTGLISFKGDRSWTVFEQRRHFVWCASAPGYGIQIGRVERMRDTVTIRFKPATTDTCPTSPRELSLAAPRSGK